ncbi:MAG: S8 family peptidase [Marinilabiliaceae bacterium]
MEQHTFLGKQRLCYTDLSDFTDFQGIGHDPLYLRYDSVMSIVRKSVPGEYSGFLAAPEYVEATNLIHWHVGKWLDCPERLSCLDGEGKERYAAILHATLTAYRQALTHLQGDDFEILSGAIKFIDEDRVFCADGKVYAVAWGMTPDLRRHKVIGSVIHDFDLVEKFRLSFDPGEHGAFSSKLDGTVSRRKGYALSADDVPIVKTDDGWRLVGWSPEPVGFVVKGKQRFIALYEESAAVEVAPEADAYSAPDPVEEEREPQPEPEYSCTFNAGEHGRISKGAGVIFKKSGESIEDDEIPEVTASDGYRFTGWNPPAAVRMVYGDVAFEARYEAKKPWLISLWDSFNGKGCLRVLLWILAAILIFWLLVWLLRSCHDGHREVNGVVSVDSVSRPDGSLADDNGRVCPVVGDDGSLPVGDAVVAPVTGGDGTPAPVIKRPGAPGIIANRLVLFLEEDDDSVDALAADFKAAYPDEKYAVIAYDRNVNYIVIQIPEDERDHIRSTINGKIPGHKFIAFDEEFYEQDGQEGRQNSNKAGWHLVAINLRQGWAVTKGDPDIKVGIVDDGIDASHPMFHGRIAQAYNVFRQDNQLSVGSGHGTHVAALACGSDAFLQNGVSGVAPNSQIMPVQVFDNGMCPLSALVSGVMYSIHRGADVVNISIGPHYEGLDNLPVEEQSEIAASMFKNVEALWRRVCEIAERKNCILVFAAGNDNILSCVMPENRNNSAISVSAVGSDVKKAAFSNFGRGADISAPGVDIYSAYSHGGFKMLDGTSMAAPIVTGTIALMKSIKRDLTTKQARNCLRNTGRKSSGPVPPMVVVDNALKGVMSGDFSDSVGDNPCAQDEGGAPSPRIGDGGKKTPDAAPQTPDETDYDAIRRLIAEYQEKIKELERLLPQK